MSSRARAIMRYLERKFKTASHASSSSRSGGGGGGGGGGGSGSSFWELQDREIDDRYKRKIAGYGGNRSSRALIQPL